MDVSRVQSDDVVQSTDYLSFKVLQGSSKLKESALIPQNLFPTELFRQAREQPPLSPSAPLSAPPANEA